MLNWKLPYVPNKVEDTHTQLLSIAIRSSFHDACDTYTIMKAVPQLCPRHPAPELTDPYPRHAPRVLHSWKSSEQMWESRLGDLHGPFVRRPAFRVSEALTERKATCHGRMNATGVKATGYEKSHTARSTLGVPFHVRPGWSISMGLGRYVAKTPLSFVMSYLGIW